MRYLICGSSGFIGSWIADRLTDCMGIDKIQGKFTHKVWDLSRAMTSYMVSQIQSEILFYLAANAREGASQFQPADVTKNNLTAYVNTLEGFIKGGGKKVVLFSSMSVYGGQTPPFDENDLPCPVDIYGWNKYAMEEITKILCDVHSLSYVIVRPHNVFGEHQVLTDKFRNVFGIWMNQCMRHEPMTIFGDGEQTRAFSYIQDCIPAFVVASHLDNETVNIGGKVPMTINNVADLVVREFSELDPFIKHLPDRPLEVKSAFCTFKKSEELLDYSEGIGIEQGIKQMATWAKRQGPQEWTNDNLSLWNDKAPLHWKPVDLGKRELSEKYTHRDSDL